MATWYWKVDLRKKETDKSCWEAYSEEDGKRLEKAYNKGQATMKFDDKYKIDFKEMIQFRITDRDRQRPIKREEEEEEEEDEESEEEVKPKPKKKKATKSTKEPAAKKSKK